VASAAPSTADIHASLQRSVIALSSSPCLGTKADARPSQVQPRGIPCHGVSGVPPPPQSARGPPAGIMDHSLQANSKFDGRSPLGYAGPVVGRLSSTVRWSGETRTARIVRASCSCSLAAVEPAVAADDPAAGISGVTSTDRSGGGLAAERHIVRQTTASIDSRQEIHVEPQNNGRQ
jgi:hypothetical protein